MTMHVSGELLCATEPIGVTLGGPIDKLCGLATRQHLLDYLDERLGSPAANTSPLGLILLDLDRFKLINDSLGPLVGDKLLSRVAQRLRQLVPGAGMIARVSGDGFAIVIADAADGQALADKLLDFLGRPYAVSGHAITLGASLGLAISGENGGDALGLLHAADLAMHQAEQDGRNRVRRYEPDMQDRARMRQAMETDLRAAMALQHVELRRALVSDQFEVHYQPQVSLYDGQPTGFEALLRWRHPERGLVPPLAFIPLAEEIGLIELLGDWVLRTACRDASRWPVPANGKPLRVAVNLSPLQFRDPRALISGIERAVLESGLAFERLELELTENALAYDIVDTLSAIRRMNIDLALDDFGTGYSSLSRLRNHPFNRLKIDRSFVMDMAEDGETQNQRAGEWMIRAIASLGLGMGLTTVVEGVETPWQYDIARRAGCTEMQGYLVSRPISSIAVPDLIRHLDENRQLWKD